jgi:hypothetical protein
MGKWTALKNKLVRYSEPDSWQQKIDKVKLGDPTSTTPTTEKPYAKLTRLELCEEMVRVAEEKDKIKEALADLNVREAAIDQVMVDMLEGEGELQVKNAFGTFFIKDDPYCSIVDREAYLKWVGENDLEELLTVNYQTTSGIVKGKLEAGEEIPPGIKVFMKSSIGYRKPS